MRHRKNPNQHAKPNQFLSRFFGKHCRPMMVAALSLALAASGYAIPAKGHARPEPNYQQEVAPGFDISKLMPMLQELGRLQEKMQREIQFPALRTRLLNATQGQAVMHHNFYDYQPYKGAIPGRTNGVLVSTETGKAIDRHLTNYFDRHMQTYEKNVDKLYEALGMKSSRLARQEQRPQHHAEQAGQDQRMQERPAQAKD